MFPFFYGVFMIHAENITSVNNPSIKTAVRLRESAAARRESSRFLAEGLRLCVDAALSGVKIYEAYILPSAAEKYAAELEPVFASAERVFSVSDAVASKLSDTKHTQGVFAVCATPDLPSEASGVDPQGIYVAAERLQDPANLGALCRTAEALGIDGIIVGSCCDVFSPKALRASMGAAFRLPIVDAPDLPALLSSLAARGMRVLGSVPDATAVKITQIALKRGVVCVIGNEGGVNSD
ncbi:MAG: RNA methyltransferase [Clostridia bacterium]|nr:RNA methyltransferase [Clostridia bacterium]